jgi:hypothetical protein
MSEMVARSLSGQRFLAMPQTACATMATATILRPEMMPIPIGPLKVAAP